VTFEIELVGGHADGQVFAVPALGPAWTTAAPMGAEWWRGDDLYPTTAPATATYLLEYNQATGQPRRTPQGRYVYRYGRRPSSPVGLPHFVADAFPDATGWERCGPGRWRASEPAPLGGDCVLLVAVVEVEGRQGFAPARVTTEMLAATGSDPDAVLNHWFRRLESLCRDLLAPDCVVPGCDRRGTRVFVAAADGRLAGRDWRVGDEVRLCLGHGYDVYRALAMRRDELPDWLRADALPESDGIGGVVSRYYGYTLPVNLRGT
jgi:hypothetical protein